MFEHASNLALDQQAWDAFRRGVYRVRVEAKTLQSEKYAAHAAFQMRLVRLHAALDASLTELKQAPTVYRGMRQELRTMLSECSTRLHDVVQEGVPMEKLLYDLTDGTLHLYEQ